MGEPVNWTAIAEGFVALVGICCVLYGLYLIHVAAALIVGGLWALAALARQKS